MMTTRELCSGSNILENTAPGLPRLGGLAVCKTRKHYVTFTSLSLSLTFSHKLQFKRLLPPTRSRHRKAPHELVAAVRGEGVAGVRVDA